MRMDRTGCSGGIVPPSLGRIVFRVGMLSPCDGCPGGRLGPRLDRPRWPVRCQTSPDNCYQVLSVRKPLVCATRGTHIGATEAREECRCVWSHLFQRV